MTIIEITDIFASYGPVPVLVGVDFSLAQGEILALLGRNGVGKTTLLRVLIGLIKPTRGRISMAGQDLTGLPSHRIAKMGVAYVPQGRGIFPKLTVFENLMVGTRAQTGKKRIIPEEIFTYFPILKDRLDQPGGTLSGGEQQMLALGRALCGRPKLLLLDEPSEGIQPSIVQQLGVLIPEIVKTEGVSVLLVEQNLDLALRAAQRCLVMEKGSIVHEGHPDDFNDDKVVKKYLAI